MPQENRSSSLDTAKRRYPHCLKRKNCLCRAPQNGRSSTTDSREVATITHITGDRGGGERRLTCNPTPVSSGLCLLLQTLQSEISGPLHSHLIYRIICDIPLPATLAPHPTPPPTARPSTTSFLGGPFVEYGWQLCSQGSFFSKKMDDLVPFRIFCRYRKIP